MICLSFRIIFIKSIMTHTYFYEIFTIRLKEITRISNPNNHDFFSYKSIAKVVRDKSFIQFLMAVGFFEIFLKL
ncbi:hypothetical protein D3C75_1192020 [compost metagenome]